MGPIFSVRQTKKLRLDGILICFQNRIKKVLNSNTLLKIKANTIRIQPKIFLQCLFVGLFVCSRVVGRVSQLGHEEKLALTNLDN